MTISEHNIVRRWKLMESMDFGIDRNVESMCFSSLFSKVFDFEYDTLQIRGEEIKFVKPIIRAFAFNENLEEEIVFIECLDLDYVNITKHGARELDWYLMNNLGWDEKYQYALAH